MASLPDDPKDAAGLPITNREMQGLLTPLQTSLQRMGKMLQDISDSCGSPLQPNSLDSWGSQVAVSCGTPTTDLLEPPLCLPTQNGSGAEPSHDWIKEIEQRSNSYEMTKDQQQTSSHVQLDVDGDDDRSRGIFIQRRIDKAFQNLTNAGDVIAAANTSAADKVAMTMDSISRTWSNIREPTRSTCIMKLATSKYFEMACQLAILLNSVLFAYMTNWEMMHLGERSMPSILETLESSFVILFLLELLVRLLAHRQYFFINDDMHWNILDLFLVSVSVIDFVLAHLPSYTLQLNASFARLLRILKVTRIFRTARLLRFYSTLPMLLDSFKTSLAPLFWGFVMLVCILYLFALIFIQGLLEPLKEGQNDIYPDMLQAVETSFGSLGKTMFSLYAAVTGGEDWLNLHQVLWVVAGAPYPMLFAVFVFLATLAVFNIITALIVEKAMSSSKPVRSELVLCQRKKDAEARDEFLEVCKAIDTDGSGKISWTEFKQWMENPVMVAYMASLGCDIHDLELFFATVGAHESHDGILLNQGEVTFEHFVDGCMHMKGSATSIDMQRQLFEMHILQEALKQFKTSCLTRLGRLEHLMANSCQQEPHSKFSM